MTDSKPRVSIIGTGAVGTTLAIALRDKGYPLHSIVSRRIEHARRLARLTGALHALVLPAPLADTADLSFLCVPDDAISATAVLLARTGNWQNKVVAHTSGALTAEVLHPLGNAGAHLMSFHPVQTFALTSENESLSAHPPFTDIYIGIEGDDVAVSLGKKIATDLGARDLVLDAAYKARYHLAAAIASNFFVTVMTMACDVLESIGMDRNEATALLRPLVTQTCTNVTTTPPEQVLTGPAARGDEKTLKKHVEAIQKHLPHYNLLYGSLLAETLDIAARTGRLSFEQSERIKENLKLKASDK